MQSLLPRESLDLQRPECPNSSPDSSPAEVPGPGSRAVLRRTPRHARQAGDTVPWSSSSRMFGVASARPDGVIYLGSFSKILAPGFRLGYVIGPEDIHLKLVQTKQGY